MKNESLVDITKRFFINKWFLSGKFSRKKCYSFSKWRGWNYWTKSWIRNWGWFYFCRRSQSWWGKKWRRQHIIRIDFDCHLYIHIKIHCKYMPLPHHKFCLSWFISYLFSQINDLIYRKITQYLWDKKWREENYFPYQHCS